MKRLTTMFLVSMFCIPGFAQQSTQDLNFLIGSWQIVHTYNPKSDSPRVQHGTMECESVLKNEYIRCSYTMSRQDKDDALMDVYFNYNRIYGHYESLWVSSTWPIKVIEKGQLIKADDGVVLQGSAEFLIEDGATEYVQDELVMKDEKQFQRITRIRNSTSSDWHHHMTEMAYRER